MEHEMQSIVAKPAAKVLAITLFFVGVVLSIATVLGAWLWPGAVSNPGLRTLLAQPFVMAIGGYILIRVFCAIYNRAAGRWGGVRLRLAEIHSPFEPKWKP